MNRFTKLMAPALVASLSLGAAVPASAASFVGGLNVRQQIVQLERKVDLAERKHQINRQEAAQLGRTVDQLQALQARYVKNGFTKSELRQIDQRIDAAERLIDRTIGSHDNRFPGKPGGHGPDRGHR